MQLGLSGYDEKPRFWRSSANVYYKIHLFFEEFFLLALETYAKKMNQPSIVLGGGGGAGRRASPAGSKPIIHVSSVRVVINYDALSEQSLERRCE